MARYSYHHQVYFPKNLLIKLSKKLLISILLVVFLISFSASRLSSQDVRKLDEYLASLNASKSPASEADGVRLYSLVYDLHPIIYLTSGELTNPLAGVPVCLTTDIGSISQLYYSLSAYDAIELITIIINDQEGAAAKLELNKLQSFQNLRFVYFLSKSELCNTPDPICEAQQITNMVSGLSNTDIQVLYKVVTSN